MLNSHELLQIVHAHYVKAEYVLFHLFACMEFPLMSLTWCINFLYISPITLKNVLAISLECEWNICITYIQWVNYFLHGRKLLDLDVVSQSDPGKMCPNVVCHVIMCSSCTRVWFVGLSSCHSSHVMSNLLSNLSSFHKLNAHRQKQKENNYFNANVLHLVCCLSKLIVITSLVYLPFIKWFSLRCKYLVSVLKQKLRNCMIRTKRTIRSTINVLLQYLCKHSDFDFNHWTLECTQTLKINNNVDP